MFQTGSRSEIGVKGKGERVERDLNKNKKKTG